MITENNVTFNPSRDELHILPMFTIYKLDNWYLVRGEGNYGIGDSMLPTFEQANQIAELEKRQHTDKLARIEAIKAAETAQEQAKQDMITSYMGFLSDNPMTRQRHL